MFGKRSSSTAIPSPPPVAPPPAVRSASPIPTRGEPKAPPPKAPLAPSPAKPERNPTERARSEEYYDVKTTVFNALIDTIDLTQLSKLDPEAAREEIRDIVSEIVAIKNVVMSISEQEELLEDICNDVLGYGPLEPLLARDDIADIMVNGCDVTYIEVNGKVQPAPIHFADNAQLMNICQRIVSQVGRRVDESSPICDARLPDGSRVNVIAPPLAIDGPTLTIRKFKRDRLTLDQLVRLRHDHARGTHAARHHRPGSLQRHHLGRHRFGQNHAAQLHDGLYRRRRARHHLRGFRRAATPAAACGTARDPPAVISKARARLPCAISSGTACVCDPTASSWARYADPRPSTCLQAMNTGHDGSMGTLHSNSPRECISRLESMILMGGYNLPNRTIREMITSSVDVIIQASRMRDGTRKITHVTEVDRHMEGGGDRHAPGPVPLCSPRRGFERAHFRAPSPPPALPGRVSGTRRQLFRRRENG